MSRSPASERKKPVAEEEAAAARKKVAVEGEVAAASKAVAKADAGSARKKPVSDGETAALRPVGVGALGDSIGYALRRAQLASTAEFLEAMKEVDLRPTQFSVLILINQNPGVRQTEVCAALGLQKANFVPLLNELERRGLAERRPGVPDRRASALHLTEEGVAVLQRALQLHSDLEDRMATRLGPKGREQLLAFLEKLT